MIFILLATLIAVSVVAWMMRPGPTDTAPEVSTDIALYRAQLADVDRDIARGTMSETEGEASRLEISRRILAADKAATQAAQSTKGPSTMILGCVVAVFIIGGAGIMYLRTGAIGYPDIPHSARITAAETARANRPDQITLETQIGPIPAPEISADNLNLIDQLRDAVAANPNDLRGLELLVRYERGLANYRAAYLAQDHLNTVKADTITGHDHIMVADLMILAANGTVSPEAEAALYRGLELDPQNGTGLYYSGLLFAQIGRPDLAFRAWNGLERNSAPDAPWMPAIRAQIGIVAEMAGETYTPPAAPRGPTGDDIANAAELSVEDRNAMIQGMVATLSDRLATEGGTATEWAQLINAYSVLNDMARVIEVWQEAKIAFADAPDDLAIIATAATNAGLTP